MCNLALALGIGANYLVHVPEVTSLKLWLFALPALLSSILMLTLLPGLLFVLLAHWTRRWLGMLQAGFWTLFQVLLFADTRIYNVFRYHFNGQVLNLMYTRGSEDAIHLGWQVWTAIGLGLSLGLSLQIWLWRRALVFAEKKPASPLAVVLRPSVLWCVVLLPAVFVEKTIYAHSALARDRQLTSLARLFPLYARVPAEDLASRVLGVEELRRPRVELTGFELDYPLADPEVPADGPRPNFLFVVIDCLRRDMLTPETAPRLSAWAEEGRLFEDHVSGGNSTRYGIFSMLYGLHGSYWFPVLQERRSPVLIDELVAAGYDFGVFSSASMNYPELRDTAWSRVPEAVRDEFPSPFPWRRDEQAADALATWLAEREDSERPFFAFILLDSPHQTYSHPSSTTPFQPSAEDLDYMSMTANEGPRPELLEAVRNRYKNAVRHADDVAGQLLEAFGNSPRAANTWTFVTGDHGEEFLENGFFGHTSAFTTEQLAVPLLVRGPDLAPGLESRPTTHMDIPSTLLELLGADPLQRPAWCLGSNLFDPPATRRRAFSGWNELGVWTPSGILRVPLSAFEFDIEVYDYSWELLLDDAAVLEAEHATLERLGAECNRFLR